MVVGGFDESGLHLLTIDASPSALMCQERRVMVHYLPLGRSSWKRTGI
jgi:hypothetical protein